MSAPASTQASARSIAASRPSTASASVRAMTTKSGSVLRVDRRLDAVDHLGAANELLARPVAAALGADLVLDVHRRRAELDQRLDRARDVEGAGAEAGVDVDQQRQVAHVGDAAHVGQHVVEVGDAEVRQAERAGGDAAAGEVDGLIAGLLGEERVVGVDRADDLQRLSPPRGRRGSARRLKRWVMRCPASSGQQMLDAVALFFEDLLERVVHPARARTRRSRGP